MLVREEAKKEKLAGPKWNRRFPTLPPLLSSGFQRNARLGPGRCTRSRRIGNHELGTSR